MAKMRILSVLILGLVIFSCVKNKNLQNPQNTVQPKQDISGTVVARHIVVVKEIIQASNYTYMKVIEGGKEDWIAVNKQDAKVGDIYYYEKALQMTNFKSKELDRMFDMIYFVTELSKDPKMISGQSAAMPPHSGRVQNGQREDIKIQKAQGELTIAELFKNHTLYTGKKVKITGVVVKVNNGIMNRNWIHIQDGTNDAGSFDLTITSQDNVKVDDKVTFEGTIAVDKDFGAGYVYDVVLEDATLASAAI
jgi:hypothetical protein